MILKFFVLLLTFELRLCVSIKDVMELVQHNSKENGESKQWVVFDVLMALKIEENLDYPVFPLQAAPL